MQVLGNSQRPLRVAIVGAGPAGFYTAEVLFKQDIHVKIDMFEKLPAPFGLVRYGVAPDHEKIKKVIKIFENIASDKRFSYFGNVKIGQDLSVDELKRFYDVCIFCYGAETDRRLGIKGEDLKGCHTANEFVGWYNGHPQYKNISFDFSHQVAVVMGHGNVAMDVARILCSNVEELSKTDICQAALEQLSKSNIKEVHVYGRRGPLQATFTPEEIKELGGLKDCCPVVNPADLDISLEAMEQAGVAINPLGKKNFAILQSFLQRKDGGFSRKLFVHFYRTPVEILGDPSLKMMRFEINDLSFKGTGQFEEIGCGLFISSIGYVGLPMQGLPFLTGKGIIPNKLGRIVDGDQVVKSCYVTGWIGNGASGVIGTNKVRAEETVHSIMEDLSGLPLCEQPDSGQVVGLLKSRNVEIIDFIDWKKINAYEIIVGYKTGKPREKILDVSKMISVAKTFRD